VPDEAGRPIVIGNGTGLAGLRARPRERAARGRHESWLVFGERKAAHDFLIREEIEGLRKAGMLQRLDMVLSRHQAERCYVWRDIVASGRYRRDVY
jgi:sulfite reductase (NADPH) flavoprotein alpha-component